MCYNIPKKLIIDEYMFNFKIKVKKFKLHTMKKWVLKNNESKNELLPLIR